MFKFKFKRSVTSLTCVEGFRVVFHPHHASLLCLLGVGRIVVTRVVEACVLCSWEEENRKTTTAEKKEHEKWILLERLPATIYRFVAPQRIFTLGHASVAPKECVPNLFV